VNAYEEEVIGENDTRNVLRFHPALAPIKAAILPLSKKLSDDAIKVYEQPEREFMVDFDESGSIGKRYRRYDEVGTPYCITFFGAELLFEKKNIVLISRSLIA
jgi:glycyl-tRNA synthetase